MTENKKDKQNNLEQDTDRQEDQIEMIQMVGEKEKRRMLYKKKKPRSIWVGLGAIGIVGWLVVIPILIGILIGVAIDKTWPGRIPWTGILLFVGLVVGCFNAWRWVMKEQKEIGRHGK